ncbi:hypothetical protein FO519_003906 [Halicephalobus sp. NKZ332]|nr:hypothetical protein FO519_003906 [Halicephalobus sp. NKZ332]
MTEKEKDASDLGCQKKPAMEKQRRDRMNRAMDELKNYLLKYDPTHPSKLEKADILEKTVELMMRFDQGKVHNHHPSGFGLARHPFPPMGNQMNHINGHGFPGIHQNVVNSNAIQHMLTQNALQAILQQQSVMSNGRIGNPLMTSSPKSNAGLNSVINAPTTSTPASETKNSILSTNSTDSRPATADDLSSESDEEIDVENVDENDSGLSPISTPRGQKRSLSSSNGDMEDSGVFEPHIKRSKTFSIDGLLKES